MSAGRRRARRRFSTALSPAFGEDSAMTPISPEEMQRRREHVKAAIADSRIEGLPPPSRPEQAILDAYIRGEIEAADLVRVYRERHG
jgi:hypothetical protein